MLACTHFYIVLVFVAAVSSFIIYPSGAFATSLFTFRVMVTNRPYSMVPQAVNCVKHCICSRSVLMFVLTHMVSCVTDVWCSHCLVFVTQRVFVWMYRSMCNDHATAGIGYYKVCTFKGGRQLGTLTGWSCILVSILSVAAPYICVIVTGGSTVPGVKEKREGFL